MLRHRVSHFPNVKRVINNPEPITDNNIESWTRFCSCPPGNCKANSRRGGGRCWVGGRWTRWPALVSSDCCITKQYFCMSNYLLPVIRHICIWPIDWIEELLWKCGAYSKTFRHKILWNSKLAFLGLFWVSLRICPIKIHRYINISTFSENVHNCFCSVL